MAAPAKFLFDTDFAAPDKPRDGGDAGRDRRRRSRPPRRAPIATASTPAQREAKAESDRRAALALEEIAIGIKAIAARFAGIENADGDRGRRRRGRGRAQALQPS